MRRFANRREAELFVEEMRADALARLRRSALRHLARRLRHLALGVTRAGWPTAGDRVEKLADDAEAIGEGAVVCAERVEELRQHARLVGDLRAVLELENV